MGGYGRERKRKEVEVEEEEEKRKEAEVRKGKKRKERRRRRNDSSILRAYVTLRIGWRKFTRRKKTPCGWSFIEECL